MNTNLYSLNFNKSVFIWLITLTLMVLAIIIIGGLTRLTGSGLSMADWRPILGTIPPLSDEKWLEVFNVYKQTPEYIYVNKNMEIDGFKFIFWWEWFHRFFARLIGIVFIIPFIYFVFKKILNKNLYFNLSIIFILGFFQALVGWWMVKSGLSDDPYVSPYRLTFHLINAIILFSLLLWSTMNYYYSKNINFFSNLDSDKIYIFISIVIVFITIITGGFMAGSDAGKSFNTYPLMNGKFFPDDYFLEGLGILNLFENTIAINFNHRWLGTISFIYIFSLFLILTFKQSTAKHKIYFFIVLLILSIQFFLGIITLLSNVKISFASMHQTNSIILFAFLLLSYHKIKVNQE